MAVFLFILTFLIMTQTVFGVSGTLHQSSSTPFMKYVHHRFGMAKGGVISISYTVAPESSTAPYDGYVLILVINEDEEQGFYKSISDENGDDTDVETVAQLCMQPSVARIVVPYGSGNATVTIDDGLVNNQYSVVLAQCRNGYASNPINIDVTVTMQNLVTHGGTYTQLPIEMVNLLRIFPGSCILYTLLTLALAAQFFFYR